MHQVFLFDITHKIMNSTNAFVTLSITKKTLIELTYADGDIGRPLIVVLAGYHPLPNEFKSKLAFKAQDISIQKATSLLIAIQGRTRVAATLFINFCREGSRTERGKEGKV